MEWSDLPLELLITIARFLTEFTGHFYSFSEDPIYPMRLCHDTRIFHVFGSASGWLLALKGHNSNLTFSLINPSTGASVRLPCPDPRSYFADVAAKTLAWDRSDSIVMASCNTMIGVFYCHIGSQSWEPIESMQDYAARRIAFHRGKFYVLNGHSYEVIILDGNTLEEILVINLPNSLWTPSDIS